MSDLLMRGHGMGAVGDHPCHQQMVHPNGCGRRDYRKPNHLEWAIWWGAKITCGMVSRLKNWLKIEMSRRSGIREQIRREGWTGEERHREGSGLRNGSGAGPGGWR